MGRNEIHAGSKRDTYPFSSCARRGGRCVRASAFCVIDRKRNSSSNQVFQRTHPPTRTPGERVGREPGGVAGAEKSIPDMRYMAQRTEPHGASLRSATSGVADCCNPSIRPCVQCREANRTGCPILRLLGLISSRTRTDGGIASLVSFWKATAKHPAWPCRACLSLLVGRRGQRVVREGCLLS